MRRCVSALMLGTLAATIAPSPPRANAAEATLRVALVVPNADADPVAAEVAAGVALAAAASNDSKAAGAKRPSVEIVTFSAGDASIASLAVETAVKEKFGAVVAVATEAVAADLESVARRAKMPLVLVGPGGPARTLDVADPVFRVEPSAADRGLALAEMLRLRSGRSSIGLPGETKKAWLVVEDSNWARAISASLRRDDVDGLVAVGETVVKPGADVDASDVKKAQADACDRVVVVGGARTVRSVGAALDKAGWDAHVLALDTALDGAPHRRRTAFVAATPAWAEQRKLGEIFAKHPPAAGKSADLTPAAARGFVAAAALIDAVIAAAKRPAIASLREVEDGAGGTQARLFDGTGCVDRWRSATWTTSPEGVVAPVKASYLPESANGAFLGNGLIRRYRAAEGETCVKVGFGGGDGRPERTIETDLQRLGLGKGRGKADEMAREQIVARTCSKLSRVWGRSYDGSARPALSFKIAFVAEGTDTKGASAVWDAVIAGDGPDGMHGGQAFLKQLRAQALSTYLLRTATLLQKARLNPPLSDADIVYLDGTYAWNTTGEGNLRADCIRALIDGVASTFCMKLSKEIGHLAGLGVDHSGDATSVMVAQGGEGVSDEFARFPPAFARVLDRTLGRVGAEGR